MNMVLIASVIVALLVGWISARGRQLPITDHLTSTLLAALLSARLVFVWQYLPQYSEHLWQVIDIRDGGFNLLAGIITAAIYLAWCMYRQPQARVPLMAASIAGLLTWGATGGAFLLLKPYAEGFPDTTLYTHQGNATSIKTLAAQHDGPIVINFWASWCPPCRAEMPMLTQAQHEHPDILFIFVNQGEDNATVQRFLDSLNLELTHSLLDPEQRLGQNALPTTLFYHRDGQFGSQHRGMLSKATLTHAIIPLLESADTTNLELP